MIAANINDSAFSWPPDTPDCIESALCCNGGQKCRVGRLDVARNHAGTRTLTDGASPCAPPTASCSHTAVRSFSSTAAVVSPVICCLMDHWFPGARMLLLRSSDVAASCPESCALQCADVDDYFSIQSSSKPITYALAMQERGEEFVHSYIGACTPQAPLHPHAVGRDDASTGCVCSS